MEIGRSLFGSTRDGLQVEQIGLDNGSIACQIITYGAALRTLYVPGPDGPVDVVLGYDSMAEYEDRDGCLGVVVGRFANRIAKGRFTLNGKDYTLAVNNGPNHLHGGRKGFADRVWTVEEVSDTCVSLSLDSPDGEEGYPGHLKVRVTYALEGTALSIRYEAESDGDTPCNLTNHSYFNLKGQGSGDILDQELQIFAEHYTPADETSIPLGTVEPVAGTPMDFRQAAAIGARIGDKFQQLIWGCGYDHNYVVDGPMGELRPAARALCRESGIAMTVETTCPGVQFYTANFLEARRGKGGTSYDRRHGFCLETQFFPDSPNQPAFPSAILRAGERFDHTTRFSFSRVEG